MRLLLDTHTAVWAVLKVEKLSMAAFSEITSPDNTVFVSVLTAWEIAIKVGHGKWPEARALLETFETQMAAAGFGLLLITVPHVRHAGLIQSPHRDPFDRLLAAQSVIEGLKLVTADAKMAALGADVMW